MLDKTQKQIMRLWKSEESCMVSVICITYNHELYIREAIESFLMQETDFPFEIIIHDDASTDNTAKIIKEYHSAYPDIVKPIFQEENQYSKGGFKPTGYAAGYSTGKYIALCEGDDYWTSNQKLKIQIEAMEEHPEVDFSFHSAYLLRSEIPDKKPFWNYGYDQTLYPDSILKCTGPFAPTSSYILRREVIGALPDWFYDTAPVGDFFFEMYGAKRGGALYINMPMSIYRVNVHSSWIFVMNNDYSLGLIAREKMLASLNLMKNDFPEYLASFRKKEAVLYCSMSSYNLRIRNNVLFRKNIEKSVSKFAFFSSKQRLVYMFRSMPYMLRILTKAVSVFSKGLSHN